MSRQFRGIAVLLMGIAACAALITATKSEIGMAQIVPIFDTSESARRLAQRSSRDAERISVASANRFHLALVTRFLLEMPAALDLHLQNEGILSRDDGRHGGQRDLESIGNPLGWTIFDKDGLGIFALVISTKRLAETQTACRIGDEIVFVSIAELAGHRHVDEKALREQRADLGGRSVADCLKLLEKSDSDQRIP